MAGKLTDIYSRRNGLLLSNFLFAAGNLTCGLARGPSTVILGRALAGLGGGGLNTISTIIASDLIPPRNRGLWQGIGSLFWGLGNGLGGVFGGFFDDVWDWRLAFLVQLPLTAASVVMICIHVERPKVLAGNSLIKRVDFLGSSLLVTAMVLFLTGLNSGGNLVPWAHPLILIALPVSALFLVAFVVVEQKVAREPVVPIRLILNRTVACACLTNWFSIMIAYALYFYIIIFFRVRGLTATTAGASLIPFSITTAVGSLGAGVITSRTGKYWSLNVGLLFLMVLATVLTAALSLSTPVWTTMIFFGIAGIAMGGMVTVTLLALSNAVAYEEQSLAISLSYAFRSTGSVIGVAIASAVFQNVLKGRLWSKFGHKENAAELIGMIRDSLDAIELLSPSSQRIAREGYMFALRAVFLTLVGLAFLGLVSGLFIREIKLHTTQNREGAHTEPVEYEYI